MQQPFVNSYQSSYVFREEQGKVLEDKLKEVFQQGSHKMFLTKDFLRGRELHENYPPQLKVPQKFPFKYSESQPLRRVWHDPTMNEFPFKNSESQPLRPPRLWRDPLMPLGYRSQQQFHPFFPPRRQLPVDGFENPFPIRHDRNRVPYPSLL